MYLLVKLILLSILLFFSFNSTFANTHLCDLEESKQAFKKFIEQNLEKDLKRDKVKQVQSFFSNYYMTFTYDYLKSGNAVILDVFSQECVSKDNIKYLYFLIIETNRKNNQSSYLFDLKYHYLSMLHGKKDFTFDAVYVNKNDLKDKNTTDSDIYTQILSEIAVGRLDKKSFDNRFNSFGLNKIYEKNNGDFQVFEYKRTNNLEKELIRRASSGFKKNAQKKVYFNFNERVYVYFGEDSKVSKIISSKLF